MTNVSFLRYLQQEWIKEKRATFGSTFIPFQLVEVSLRWLLFSRASVRFSQHYKYNKLTQFIEQTLELQHRKLKLRYGKLELHYAKIKLHYWHST